jgi:hypothetical protein
LEVHMSTILVLLMAGNEVQRWSGLAWYSYQVSW